MDKIFPTIAATAPTILGRVAKDHDPLAEAKTIMRDYLQADRRFDNFDPDRLIERISEARSNGRTMDLYDDPWLRRGGQKRPGSW